MCKLLGISKDTYYKSKNPIDNLSEKYAHLKPKIIKVINDNPSYGYVRIKKALYDVYGIKLNHKVLLKLLRVWHLSLGRKISRNKKKGLIYNILKFLDWRANLLINNPNREDVFKFILTDFTQIKFKGGIAYLCVHMDYSGKYVYGYSISLKPDTQMVIRSIKMAISTLKKFGMKDFNSVIFHQDQGSVYTGIVYVSYVLCVIKSTLSYSRKGTPGDNAVNESFFSRLKEENREYFSEAKDFRELERMIKNKIKYYNNKRYHSSLNLKPPLEYTREKAKELSHNK